MTGTMAFPGLAGAPRLSDRAVGHDNNFNLMRMIAASGVLVSHAYPVSLGSGAAEPLQGLLQGTKLGTVCVYVFFVISGFFITRSFDLRHDAAAFLRARALRLFPALIVATLVMVALGAAVTTAPAGSFLAAVPAFVLRTLTLFSIPLGLPGVFDDNPFPRVMNGSLWTLFYEVACYGTVLLAGLAGVLGRRWLTLPAAALFLGFYAAAMTGGLHLRLERFADLGLPFLIGALMWVWRDRVILSPWLAAALWALAVVAWWTPAFLPVFVLALAYTTTVAGFARSGRLLAYNRLGDYSYGTYVYAFPVPQLLAGWGVTTPVLNMANAFVLTLALAILSWRLVEKPAQDWGRRLDRQGRALGAGRGAA